jgi:hypothetical protein
LGLDRFDAATAAVAFRLVNETAGYGIGLTNFTFSGHGTYSQLFALLFFPLAVGKAHRVWRGDSSVLSASLFFAAVVMSDILTGYMAALWISADALLLMVCGLAPFRRLIGSAVRFLALSFLWTAHWVIPIVLDRLLQCHSAAEPAWKWTGMGAAAMISSLGKGELLDGGRFPVLTILATAGLGAYLLPWCRPHLSRFRQSRSILGFQALLWILLSFGPQTWGRVLSSLPFSGQLHWHRFFAGAQIALILCIGTGLRAAITAIRLIPGRFLPQSNHAAVLLCAIVLIPCVHERSHFFHSTNILWLTQAANFPGDRQSLMEVGAFAAVHRDARFYFGYPGNWGKQLNAMAFLPMYAWSAFRGIDTVGTTIHHQSHTETLAYEADPYSFHQRDLMNVRYLGMPPEAPVPSQLLPVLKTATLRLYDGGATSGFFAVGSEAPGGCADSDSIGLEIERYLGGPFPGAKVFPPVVLASDCRGKLRMDEALVIQPDFRSGKPPGQILFSGRTQGPDSSIHRAKLRMERDGLAVLKVEYHPNWRFLANGRETPSFMVLPGYSACRLGPGDWDLEAVYRPDGTREILLIMSLGGLMIIIGKRIWENSQSAGSSV